MPDVPDRRSRLLLISNSTLYGSGYLDYVEEEIQSFLGSVRRVLFVPFALHEQEAYAAKAVERLGRMGYLVDSLHAQPDRIAAVHGAESIFIGGGNTFRLLRALYLYGLLDVIRGHVMQGLPYMGASAGANVACPTIRTTNDMPIVEPPSLNALGVFPFQINPHYVDPDPDSTHMGETRQQRILEYLEENVTPVIALREGALLRVEQGRVLLKGASAARIFRRGHEPVEVRPVAALDLNAADALEK